HVELGPVARRATEKAPARRKRTRPGMRRRRLRLLWAVAVLGIAVYLYYRPLATYLETRDDLAARRAEVDMLRIASAQLELRVFKYMSGAAAARGAPRI